MMQFIHSGRAYRTAHPRVCNNGFINDRVVLEVNLPGGDILYASPALAGGRRARCRLSAFKRWAAEDVTLHLNGQWEHKTLTHAEVARIGVPEEITKVKQPLAPNEVQFKGVDEVDPAKFE